MTENRLGGQKNALAKREIWARWSGSAGWLLSVGGPPPFVFVSVGNGVVSLAYEFVTAANELC
jgi:hypothetical protein